MAVPDEIRERVARWFVDNAQEVVDDLDIRNHYVLEPVDVLPLADAVLAVLDRPTLIAMLGAEQVGWIGQTMSGRPEIGQWLTDIDGTEREAVYRIPAQEDAP